MNKNNKEILEKFISYFDNNKYNFEIFCSLFLRWLGFDEIKVTSKSKDHGIDLTCEKREINGIQLDPIKYAVQVKCKKLHNLIGGPDIRNLKGIKTSVSTRKIFITTSTFSKDAIDEAKDDNNPIILIDGYQLLDYLIENNVNIFDISYSVNYDKLNNILAIDKNEERDKDNNINYEVIEKEITKNDVRASILRFPTEIKKDLENSKKYKVSLNGGESLELNVSKDKRYFSSGVTKIYRELGFTSDINFSSALSLWRIDRKNKIIYVTIK